MDRKENGSQEDFMFFLVPEGREERRKEKGREGGRGERSTLY